MELCTDRCLDRIQSLRKAPGELARPDAGRRAAGRAGNEGAGRTSKAAALLVSDIICNTQQAIIRSARGPWRYQAERPEPTAIGGAHQSLHAATPTAAAPAVAPAARAPARIHHARRQRRRHLRGSECHTLR